MSQLLQYYKSFQQSRQAAATFTPTFEDLTIDDTLTELQRLVKYAKSAIGLQRLVHVKMLAYVASNQTIDIVIAQIVPLLEVFSNDNEPAIRQNLIEQMIPFGKYCHNQGIAGYRVMLDYILPLTSKLLEDQKPEVRHAASITLVEIAKLVKTDDLGQHVLTIVLKLAHEDDKEEMRMTASELLNMLAECLGQDLCRQFVIPEVVSLAEDPVFRVRKSTALNFHNICKVGGEHELFERLMPAFVRLSKDDIYRVRRACAESLSDISKYVSNDIRIGVLVEIFLRLAQDPSRLVKQSILQQSGIFISTLPPKFVNDVILSHYCSMANEPTGDMTVDAELKHHCAYSFPAVLQTIGSSRWKEIRDVYHSLVQSRSVSVKQTLAASLHEVARILADGNDLEEELGPIFEEMVQDVEEVQMGVLKNLAVFLGFLPEPCRISYLPVLHDITHSTNPFNWRLRQALALQLPALIDLPPKSDVFNMLFPLVLTLLQDPVADVRRHSYKGVSKLILVLYEQTKLEISLSRGSTPRSSITQIDPISTDSISKANSNISTLRSSDVNIPIPSEVTTTPQNNNAKKATNDLELVIRGINMLIKGESYQTRQLWLELCHLLLLELPKELFEKSFIEGILKLTTDSVINVRIAVSLLLTGWPNDAIPVVPLPTQSPKKLSVINSFKEGRSSPLENSSEEESNLIIESKSNDSKSNNSTVESDMKTKSLAEPESNLESSLELKISELKLEEKQDMTTTTTTSATTTTTESNVDKRTYSSPWSWLLQRPDIKECVLRLSKDDHDVYNNMIKLQFIFLDVVFEKISCRGQKQPPGGTEPIKYAGVTSELEIPLDLDGDDDDKGRSSMILSPGNGGLDLSDSTAAHIHYPPGGSPRGTNGIPRTFPPIPPPEGVVTEGMASIEGFEDFMNTLDMGPMHV